MKGKVVHLPDEIHGLLKGHCEGLGVSMTEFVASLIKKKLDEPESRGAFPVEKKKLPAVSEEWEEVPAYSLPPFWVMRGKRETRDEQPERVEGGPVTPDEGPEEGRGGGEEDRFDVAKDRIGYRRASGHKQAGKRSFAEELEERLERCGWPPDVDGGAEEGGGGEDEACLGQEEERKERAS